MKFDNTIESYFLESDLAVYNAFLDQFGTDEIIALGLADDDVFSPQSLQIVDRISKAMERLSHVRRVLSLTTAQTVYGHGGQVEFADLVGDLDTVAANHAGIRARAYADPFIPRTLVSRDGRRTAVVAEIDHLIGQFDYKVTLLEQVRAIARSVEAGTGKHLRLAGTAVLDDAVFRYTQRDQQLYMPFMIALIVAVTAVIFRSLRVLVLPVAIVVMTIVWTYGVLALLGYKINVVSTIIPPLLLAVAIADSMHILADYLQELARPGTSARRALEACFGNVVLPCLLTSLTTVAGLLSLLAADLAPLRQFGLVAACGVAFAFALTVSLMPWLPSLVPAGRVGLSGARERRRTERLLVWLGTWRHARAITLIVLALVVTAFSAGLLPRLGIGTNALDFFKPDDPVRLDTEWIDHGIGGTTSLEFHIDTARPDALKQPELLRKMARFQHYLAGVEGITGVYSIVDFVRVLNRAFNGGAADQYRIPDSEPAIAQQLLLVEGTDDLRALTSDDYSQGRITARIEMDKSRQIAHEMAEIERRMHAIFGATSVRPTGLVFLMGRMEHYLLTSQIKSFGLAFAVIGAVLFVLLRSWKLGLIAIVPNVVPVVMTLGVMPLVGIRLDVGTVMIAAIVIGLIVDDTIHFLARWEIELQKRGDCRAAIAAAMHGVGRPIIYTSVVLCAGFSVLTLASFNPVIHFGELATLAIALALMCDLLLLPALLGLAASRRVGAGR